MNLKWTDDDVDDPDESFVSSVQEERESSAASGECVKVLMGAEIGNR